MLVEIEHSENQTKNGYDYQDKRNAGVEYATDALSVALVDGLTSSLVSFTHAFA